MLSILHVEDDDEDSRALQRVDEFNENMITRTVRLSEVGAMLCERNFDAILLDLTLPVVGGHATIESIVQCSPGVPIIVVIEQAQATPPIHVVEAGAQGFPRKAVLDVETVKRLVHDCVERKRAKRSDIDSEMGPRSSSELIRAMGDSSDDEMYADVLELIVEVFQSRFGSFARESCEGDAAMCHLVDCGDGTEHSRAHRWIESTSHRGSPVGGFRWWIRDQAAYDNVLDVAQNRFVQACVSYHGEILGTIRIAGREAEYCAADQQLLDSLAVVVAPVLGARSQRDRNERERDAAEAVLLAERKRAEVTLQLIGDAVITTDADGAVQYLNPVAQKLTGWTAVEALGQALSNVFRVVYEETREAVPNRLLRCHVSEKGVGRSRQIVLISRAGHEYSIQHSAAPIRGRDEKILGAVLVFNDISESRRMAREISHQANHDALTGLMNRRAFEERLRHALGSARVDGSQHALCILDLDQFKVINDTCGHLAGDELLRQFAECMCTNTRMRDSASRIGGDEFGILMEHCPLEQAESAIGSLRQALEEFRFFWEGKSFRVGASYGLIPITAASESVSAVLRAADAACYTAKDKGRDRVHVAQVDDVELVHRHGEMQWVTRINDALEHDRFCLYFQPIAALTIEQPQAGTHFELLLRMVDDGDVILPSVFLPVAERYSLATRIDKWVIERSLQWLRADPVRLSQVEQCAINLSGQSLGDEEFLEFVLKMLRATPDVAKKICFEITETAAIRNLSKGIRFITTLKQQGCQFALDDFGSGLSSFGYLKSLPVDYLKIDGQFVRDIVDDPINLAMVKSIHEIATVMGKRTIAEFVESTAILESLRSIGVDYVQGNVIAPPLALERFSAAGQS